MHRQIFIRGGSSFGNPRPFYDYFVKAIGKPAPRVLYIGTANGNSDFLYRLASEHFARQGCIVQSLSLFGPVPGDMTKHLQGFDAIWVSGGNTVSMLALWKLWGVDTALEAAYKQGIVLGGTSAGGLCWFEGGTTDSYEGPLRAINNGLGLLPYTHCPHYDTEETRRPIYQKMVKDFDLQAGYAVDDDAILHFIDGKLHKTLTLRQGKTAFFVSPENKDGVSETALEAELLT